jgi:hypothetical protein
MLQLAKHVHAKFQLSSFCSDGLRQIFYHSLFKPSSIFTEISKVILNFSTPEFALEILKFQNSEYKVHQSNPTDEG